MDSVIGSSRDGDEKEGAKKRSSTSPNEGADQQVPKDRSKVQADYFARLKASGCEKKTFWLSPEAVQSLKKLRPRFKSNEEVVAHSLNLAAQHMDSEKP